MNFNTLYFILFVCSVVALFCTVNQRFRIYVLLIASCLFCISFSFVHFLILLGTVGFNYLIGLGIQSPRFFSKKTIYLSGLIANIAFLAYYKYANFFINNIQESLMFVGWPGHLNNLNIIAPIGLSFLTFQAISYLIDIKREAIEPEKNFFHLTIYFLYFPKILAGPIERANTFLSQLKQPLKACPSTIKDGLKLCLLGFFKKLVIADRLTEYVNKVYDAPDYFSSQALIAATIFFTIQLYCDFSGYCDIGMGISKMLGIKLTKNFNHPFFAESFTDFWKRWHITLSSWLRDYVFLPLCGRRAKHIKIYRSIIIVFAISGLWHGANWTFIVWGLLHGVFIVIENIIKRIFKNHEFNLIPQQLVISLKIVLTFFLVTATRVFFRAKNIDEALYIFKRMFTIAGNFDFSEGRFLFFLAIIMLLIYEITAEYFSKKLISLSNNSRLLKLGFTVTIIALIILLGEFNGGRFIYARF